MTVGEIRLSRVTDTRPPKTRGTPAPSPEFPVCTPGLVATGHWEISIGAKVLDKVGRCQSRVGSEDLGPQLP